MRPGQRVRAVVRLEEAEGVIAIPRGAVFEKDGKRVVYRREGGSFVPVEITIARQSIRACGTTRCGPSWPCSGSSSGWGR